jgi:hypothetical protein
MYAQLAAAPLISTNPLQARGFILRPPYRDHFPLPPPDVLEALGPDFDPEELTLQFDDNYGRPGSNLMPITIPFYIRAPYFKPNPMSNAPFSSRQDPPVSEYMTVRDIVGGLFTSMVSFYGRAGPETVRSVSEHESERSSVVLAVTSRGRLLEIARETCIKDIVAGARWPRPQGTSGGLAFKDLRTEPRPRDDEIDGIELAQGWMMELYVLPRNKLDGL